MNKIFFTAETPRRRGILAHVEAAFYLSSSLRLCVSAVEFSRWHRAMARSKTRPAEPERLRSSGPALFP